MSSMPVINSKNYTVADAIRDLEKLPPDAVLVFPQSDDWGDYRRVRGFGKPVVRKHIASGSKGGIYPFRKGLTVIVK